MKGLKKIALASAIAAISAGAQAELKALDDSIMGEMTGQAGLTLDIETKWTLGEFMYKDENPGNVGGAGGSIIIQNISLGGNTNETGAYASEYLDNFRLNIDVAGAGDGTSTGNNVLAFGLSNTIGLSTIHVLAGSTDVGTVASGSPAIRALMGLPAGLPMPVDLDRTAADGITPLMIDRPKTFGDGDLVIKSTFTDVWQKGGGFDAYVAGTGSANYTDAQNGVVGTTSLATMGYTDSSTIYSKAVDFNFSFEVLGLAASNYNPGDAAAGNVANQASTNQQHTAIVGAVINKTDHLNGYDPDTTTTTLISDLSINGYFGPSDFIIRNRGNGFGANVNGYNYGDAVSKIETARYIAITDLDVYIDIAGVAIKDLAIHNLRGDRTGLNQEINPLTGLMENTSSYDFAHTQRNIYATKDSVLNPGAGGIPGLMALAGAPDLTSAAVRPTYYQDGIVLENRFKGDIDIPHLSFGNTGVSIGEIYLTDYTNYTNLTISAH